MDLKDSFETSNKAIDDAATVLRSLDKDIHEHPETAYQEFYAVERITKFLQDLGYTVQPKAYGLDTSFVAEVGTEGPIVIICAEYDALPGIGHACGHNLIATSSIAAFLGAAEAIRKHKLPGIVRLLGTPAEEGGGGKVKLIDAGAFKGNIAAAIMAHPVAQSEFRGGYTGLAGFKLIASSKFKVEFFGRTAHAGAEPWNGVNALDAAVATYNSVSMLRQHMHPDERVHGVIEHGGTVPNVVTDYTRMNWYVRASAMPRCEALTEKVRKCCEAGAISTGCEVKYTWTTVYKNLRANKALCRQYVQDMALLDEKIRLDEIEPFTASTDMGNVSYEVPSFHGAFFIHTEPNVAMHNPKFTQYAGTDVAHDASIKVGKGMAMLAIRLLLDKDLVSEAWKDFEDRSDIVG